MEWWWTGGGEVMNVGGLEHRKKFEHLNTIHNFAGL